MLIILLGIILSVAYLTLFERKLMGAIQRRVGPNKVGIWGLLQPLIDGIKLILKETLIGLDSNHFIFLLAPFLTFLLALTNWLFLPLSLHLVYIDILGIGILIIIAITELGIFGVIYAGWAANTKYPIIGSIRSTAQMISYSISLSIIILCVIMLLGELSIINLLYYPFSSYSLFLLPLLPIFLLTALAETNRAPFDLPEAESELVAGFFTEHSAIGFVFYFLAEYTSIITICTFFSLFFFGFSSSIFGLIFFITIRTVLPRLRFDQLLNLGWSYLLPFLIAYILLLPSLLFSFDW